MSFCSFTNSQSAQLAPPVSKPEHAALPKGKTGANAPSWLTGPDIFRISPADIHASGRFVTCPGVYFFHLHATRGPACGCA